MKVLHKRMMEPRMMKGLPRRMKELPTMRILVLRMMRPIRVPPTHYCSRRRSNSRTIPNKPCPLRSYKYRRYTYFTAVLPQSSDCEGLPFSAKQLVQQSGIGNEGCGAADEETGPQDEEADTGACQDEEGADEGAPLQDDEGTPPQDDEGTPPQDDEGTPPQDDEGTPPQDDEGTPPQDDEGAPLQDDEGTPLQDDEGIASQDDEGSLHEEADTGATQTLLLDTPQ